MNIRLLTLIAVVAGLLICLHHATFTPGARCQAAPMILPQPTRAATKKTARSEIDELRARIRALEARVVELEMQLQRYRIDKRGVVHDWGGKPIGVWGIDDPHIVVPVSPR